MLKLSLALKRVTIKRSSTSLISMATMPRIYLTAPIQFVITILPKHRKLMLNYNKSQSHTNTIPSTPFMGAIKTIVQFSEITKYAYLLHYIRKLQNGIMRCSVIQGRPEQNTPSVNTLTGEAFVQHSTTCVRSAQLAKQQKPQIRNMENCHLNRLKQIPGTLYVQTSMFHIRSLGKEKTRLNCGA